MRAFVIASCVLFVGCIPSLHPIYTPKDLTFDPAIVGIWKGKDSKDTWAFTKAGENSYRMIYTDGSGKKGHFVVHLTKLGDKLFLDLYPEPTTGSQENDLYNLHLVPTHTFFRVFRISPDLEMAMMSPKWLEDNPSRLRHEKVENDMVITASTAEIQSVLVKYADDTTMFEKGNRLVRQGQ